MTPQLPRITTELGRSDRLALFFIDDRLKSERRKSNGPYTVTDLPKCRNFFAKRRFVDVLRFTQVHSRETRHDNLCDEGANVASGR